MNYQEFIKGIKEELQKQVGNELEVVVQKTEKNNGLKLDGIVLKREGDITAPVHYLQGYFEEFEKGKSLSWCANKILKVEALHQGKAPEVLPILHNWEKASKQVFPMLINREWNQETIKNMPYREFLDLAVIYYIKLDTADVGEATAKINHGMLKLWGIEEQELYDRAMENLKEKSYPEIKGMLHVLEEMLFEEVKKEKNQQAGLEDMAQNMRKEIEETGGIGFYVLTNRDKIKGASCLLYTELLVRFGEQVGKNFYILPSSIHELLLMPDMENMQVEELRTMVAEVNEKEVAVDEVLSGQVYYFERDDAILRIA